MNGAFSAFWDIFQRALGRSDVAAAGDVFLRRWKLVSTPWFGVSLHNFVRSDVDAELHDHPFGFASIILWGGYYEDRVGVNAVSTMRQHTGWWLGSIPIARRWYGPGSILFRRATDLHRVELRPDRDGVVGRATCWTLVFRLHAKRHWGFLTATGWQPWEEFVSEHGNTATQPSKWTGASSY